MSHGLVLLGSEGLPQAVKKHRFSDAPHAARTFRDRSEAFVPFLSHPPAYPPEIRPIRRMVYTTNADVCLPESSYTGILTLRLGRAAMLSRSHPILSGRLSSRWSSSCTTPRSSFQRSRT